MKHPEGQQIGIVKNLAMQTYVTIQTADQPVRIILTKLGVSDLIEVSAKSVMGSTKIFVNGDWVGIIHEELTKKLYDRLKVIKRHGVIVPYISMAWFIHWKEIHIQTDGGRYSRPLYVVEQNQLVIARMIHEKESFAKKFYKGNLKWTQLLGEEQDVDPTKADVSNGGCVEYLDTNEIETTMIAMTAHDLELNSPEKETFLRYTHCEIHPMMMNGIVAVNIPFSIGINHQEIATSVLIRMKMF